MSNILMGTAEIRERLGGISRQRVYQLTCRTDWPTPYDQLVQGKVWRRSDIEDWIKHHRPTLDNAAPRSLANQCALLTKHRRSPELPT